MSGLSAVRWVDLKSVRDDRGVLTAVESETDIPFQILRVFWVHHATTDRGGHSHRDTDQVVTAVAGSLTMEVSDGTESRALRLDDPTRGVYVPRMVFIDLKGFSPEAVCLVLASSHYDMRRSIRSYAEYLEAVRG
ncbi:MAG: FdtA/QdtA family cupin domain-containing protein [Polyangiaceae bacterium]|nr:FdtA/QdtA family cupin domain-containing protein [Polyangiaceae bacterium]